MILREENQRTLHLHSQPLNDATIMVVRKGKTDLVWSHCGKLGNLKEQCYRLIGFPPNFKFTRGRHVIQSSAHQVSFQDQDNDGTHIMPQNNAMPQLNHAMPQLNHGAHTIVAPQVNTMPPLNLSRDQIQKLMDLIETHTSTQLGSHTLGVPEAHLTNAAGPLTVDHDWLG